MDFRLVSPFQSTGDQPKAIQQLSEGIARGEKNQVLLGVTGSGKTFTMANVVEKLNRPTLILSHNKTLAAQLYGEFKQFFPDNAVEYFISYYDYYQPEAYIPSSGVYIEKDLSINKQIEKMRLSTTSALLSGRRDVLVVASVSCIYGIGNPEEFGRNKIELRIGQSINRRNFLFKLTEILYTRTEANFTQGSFRVKGDTVDVFLAYADYALRIYFFGDEIEALHWIDPSSGTKLSQVESSIIFPANLFVTDKEQLFHTIKQIQEDLVLQMAMFEQEGRLQEAKRLKERTEFDMEMMRELGYCSGIENYSRYFDRRLPGTRPFCLLDYFPEDFLLFIDESHVTIPQIRAMWGGDRSRKVNLVDYGFRLPAALDNRPLTFQEFETLTNQVVFVSATPADYELQKSEGVIVEQLIRPTGILDPIISVRPSKNQIDDLLDEINIRVAKKERVIVTTLTKRMAEEMAKFLDKARIKCRYIHSDVETLDRVEILRELRMGVFDVIVGVNLLREGLDLPEVSLVAVLDADKEGFLRSQRSLIQIIGRAARHLDGMVIMYADDMTPSMQAAIDETNRRRKIQAEYNAEHGIVPTAIKKSNESILSQTKVADAKMMPKRYAEMESEINVAADPVVQYMTLPMIKKLAEETKAKMEKAAKDEEFMEAARLRDEYFGYLELMKKKEETKMV